MRVEIIHDMKYLKELRETWDLVFEKSAERTPFQSFIWNMTWWTVFGQGRDLFVLVIYSEIHAVAIFPLMISKEEKGPFSLRKIQFIGVGKSDYMGPILADDPESLWQCAIEALYDHRHLWDIAEFGRMREGTDSLRALNHILPDQKKMKCVTEHDKGCLGCPSILIRGEWKEYHRQAMSPRTQSTYRRKFRKLRDKGEVSFSENGNKQDLIHSIAEMAALEQKSWKGQQRKGIFKDSKNREFVTKVCVAFADLGWLRIDALKYNDRILSFYLGFLFDSRYYMYSTSYDPDFALYSPGTILLVETIRNCFKRKLIEYDFLQGEENYKLEMCNNLWKIRKVLLFHDECPSNLMYSVEKYSVPFVALLKRKLPGLNRLLRKPQ